MATQTNTRVERRQKYRRVEYKCKLCPDKNFGDPEELHKPGALERGFLLWLSSVAAHSIVHHPKNVGTVPINELVVPTYL